MATIKDIFLDYGPRYLETFGDRIPRNHRKVLRAITACRTPELGAIVYQCGECGQAHLIPKSCGNRHCPTCQNNKTRHWLDKQIKKQLPGHHFMLTFTVPEQIRPFIRSHQRDAYAALFAASSGAIKKLVNNPKWLGADLPGFFGVLHTWGRQLSYHPHIHYIVPGGAFSRKDNRWRPSRIDFFLPVRALSKLFRGIFRDIMKQKGHLPDIPPEVWNIDWNVNSQAVGHSGPSLTYLAPYVFKVAISNARILKVENDHVFFTYRKPGSHRLRTMTLPAIEFIRRFLQHVLPTGFMKVRYYGFLAPGSSVPLDTIRTLIEMAYAFTLHHNEPVLSPLCPLACSACGGRLVFRYLIPRPRPDLPSG